MKVYEVCFSPTGGTKKAADMLAEKISGEHICIDLTDINTEFGSVSLSGEDIAVIAVPSYGGRVPQVAAERISEIKGNGAKAVIVCVYGNRAYEDTLTELEDCAEEAGFNIIAAVAAIAEHSIARKYASGRPDEEDCAQLEKFAERISEKIVSGGTSKPQIPGNRPYKKRGGKGMVPKASSKKCVKCGVCAEKCPVAAIDRTDPLKTDSDKCISCMRCVSVCPHSARSVNSVMLAAVNAALKPVCSERKDCELYI